MAHAHTIPVSTAFWKLGFLALLFSVVVVLLKKAKAVVQIRRLDGKRIKILSGDARVAKFAQADVLSSQGQSISGECPFLIRNGCHRELVITKPSHLNDFYKDDTRHHPKPKNLNMGSYFGELLGDAVGVQAGERWTIIRRYFNAAFDLQTSRSAIPLFTSSIQTWLHQLQTGSGSVDVNLASQCRFLPFQLVSQLLYGACYNDQVFAELLSLNKEHEVILHDVIGNKKLISPLWRWLNPAARRRMDEYNAAWERLNLDIVHRSRTKAMNVLADQIYRGVDLEGQMKKTEFLHTMDEILFANVDVSSRVLIMLFQNMSTHPEIQAAVRTEIAAVAPQDLPAYYARTDTLLNFTIMEAMRLSPAFAFSLPESTSRHKIIGGFNVPARTPVVIDAVRLNRDPESWGLDSDQFNPERFRSIEARDLRYSFMRFGVGGGAGRCLGKNVADLIFKITLAEVLNSFNVEECAGKEGMVRFVGLERQKEGNNLV